MYTLEKMNKLSNSTEIDKQIWLQNNFQVYAVSNTNGNPDGLLTSYYEPEFNASRTAKNGYEVSAFDYSESGQQKALMLAQEHGISINYIVSDVLELPYENESFDALVLIFAHFPAEIRKQANLKLLELLKPEGKILFEAFSKEQLNYTSGGPKDVDMLFSEEEVRNEFPGISFDSLSTEKIVLDEGLFHQGEGVVVRFVGTKK